MRCIRRFPLLAAFLFLLSPLASSAGQSCGDVNNSGGLSSSDALLVLKAAVGQNVTFDCPAPGTLLATGQTTCADLGGATISCNGTNQDGDLQAGLPFDYTDNGNGSITDNVTGLTWEKLSQDSSVHDVRNTYSWTDAFSRIASLNNDSFAGHDDWRMPNLRELQSLVSLQVPGSGAVVQPEFNTSCSLGCTVTTCSCTAPSEYWSSTNYPFGDTNAMGIYFGGGGAFATTKDTAYRVRAVRGGVVH